MARVDKIRAFNIKKVSEIEHDLTGHSVYIIGGKNSQGKTSGGVDAFLYALGGGYSIPDDVIKHGEEEGEVEVTLSGVPETLGPEPILKVRREFKRGKKGRVTITGEDGKYKITSPQDLLDTICSKQTFDPRVFINLKPTEQGKILLDLAGVNLDELNKLHKDALEKKRQTSKNLSVAKATLGQRSFHEGVPSEFVDAAGLGDQLTSASKTNRENEKHRRTLGEIRSERRKLNEEARALEERLLQVKAQIGELGERERKGAEFCAQLKDVDTESLSKQIASAMDVNNKVRENQEYTKAQKDVEELEKQHEADLSNVAAARDAKKTALSKAKWPLDGLEFDETLGVVYNGSPVGNLSSSEQIKVSVAIGARMCAELRTFIVRDGSLLDTESMEVLAAEAEANDCQLIIEVVTRDESDEKRCSIVIEDGKAKSA